MAEQTKTSRTFGDVDYRQGALERIAEAKLLLAGEMFSGGIYLAGRGVEGMLRAVLWRRDSELRTRRKTLDTGHDLVLLLRLIQDLGLLRQGDRDEVFRGHVQLVGRLWFNNMRFASIKKVENDWRRLGEIGRKRTLKRAAIEYYDKCSVVVRRCEAFYEDSD